MKRAESKVRYLGIGVLLAAFLAGGCDGLFTESLQESQSPYIGYNTGDMVTVKVAAGNGGRSVTPGTERYLADRYEVVFKKGADYYRGVGDALDGYLSVSVPIGTGYQVLLLAGYKQTLLAAGYVSSQKIEAGKVNTVSISLNGITPQWDGTTSGSDYGFSVTTTTVSGIAVTADSTNRYLKVVTGTDGFAFDTSDTFTVSYGASNLTGLIAADVATGGNKLTIEGYNVRMWTRYQKDLINDGDLTAVDFVPDSGMITGSSAPYTINDTTSPLSFTSNTALPGKDIDLFLEFELKYRAFGDAASGGITWFIRNGLNRAADVPDSVGGLFVVKFGKGTPAERQDGEMVSVSF
jgi:hypothetical protein